MQGAAEAARTYNVDLDAAMVLVTISAAELVRVGREADVRRGIKLIACGVADTMPHTGRTHFVQGSTCVAQCLRQEQEEAHLQWRLPRSRS